MKSKPIIDPTVYDPPQERLKRGAVGRRSSNWFRKMVVLQIGNRHEQTVHSLLGQFGCEIAGKAHVRDNS